MKFFLVIFSTIFCIQTHAMEIVYVEYPPAEDSHPPARAKFANNSVCALVYGGHKPPFPLEFEDTFAKDEVYPIWNSTYKKLLNRTRESIAQQKKRLNKDVHPSNPNYARAYNYLRMLEIKLDDNHHKARMKLQSFETISQDKHIAVLTEIPKQDLVACLQWTDGGGGLKTKNNKFLKFTTGEELDLDGDLCNCDLTGIIRNLIAIKLIKKNSK